MLSSRFSLARSAFRRRDVRLAEAAHSHEHLEHSLYDRASHSQHLADAVLGATDGIVTTFAVVSGAVGAHLSAGIVLVMGFANLVADGFSMAVGNYLGARSQQDYWREERNRELWEIEHLPEAEREEVRRIYRDKGLEGQTLQHVVEAITADKHRWLDEMMRQELGIQEERIAPVKSGCITFAAFFGAGLLPLLPYILAFVVPSVAGKVGPVSLGVTAVALFGVGAARRIMTRRAWWQSGLEILLMGGIAAACAFFVGYALRGLIL